MSCRDCVADLLSVCRGDYCHAERAGHIERARREAGELGHRLSEFTKIERRALWQAHCDFCGLEAVISLNPRPGQPSVSGRALSDECDDDQ